MKVHLQIGPNKMIVPVDAVCMGWWCYHKSIDSESYHVTHIPTGNRITKKGITQIEAMRLCYKAEALEVPPWNFEGDWTDTPVPEIMELKNLVGGCE